MEEARCCCGSSCSFPAALSCVSERGAKDKGQQPFQHHFVTHTCLNPYLP